MHPKHTSELSSDSRRAEVNVHGVTLATYMNSFPRHQIPLHAAVYTITRILRGAAWMHAAEDGRGQPLNLVHRDLKPANIFLGLRIAGPGLWRGRNRRSSPRIPGNR